MTTPRTRVEGGVVGSVLGADEVNRAGEVRLPSAGPAVGGTTPPRSGKRGRAGGLTRPGRRPEGEPGRIRTSGRAEPLRQESTGRINGGRRQEGRSRRGGRGGP